MEFNFEGFKKIVTTKQENLRRYISGQMKTVYGESNVNVSDKYIYCKGSPNILLVCHMDTVHDFIPSTIIYDKDQGIICSPQGIGGDDRCGIYIALSVLKYASVRPSILFTCDEEIGCVGAKRAATDLKDQCKDFHFLLELDRQGKEDVVFYETTNSEFMEYIQSFGFKKETGKSSDIRYLSDKWKMASANVSVGYIYEHCKHEMVYTKWMMDTLQRVINIVNASGESKYYPMLNSPDKGSKK